MRWITFAIFAFVMLIFEIGLRPLLHWKVSIGWVCPSFILILAAYVGLLAPARVVPWAMLALGFLQDLQEIPVGDPVSVTPILGPATLGYLLGGFAIVRLRGVFYRSSPLAVAAMAFTAGVFVNLVAVALLTFRGVPLLGEPIGGWNVADQLFRRFLELSYSTLLAVPVGYLLLRFQGLWGFETSRGPGMRR